MRLATALALVPAVLLASCIGRRGPPTAAGYPEATSLLGAPLYAVERPRERRQELEADLATAYAAYERDPDNADAIIWLGRRVAYLGRYRDALGIFSEGIRKHPEDPRMYRHRGHRWITVREFDRAVQDLEQAARLLRSRPDEVEPDGAPNVRNEPRSTLHWNVWYHLGLAHYLRGEFSQAQYSFRNALAVSQNDDARVTASDWMYMTLRRMGREEEAAAVLGPIREGMDVIENRSYYRRLLMYKGVISPDSLLALPTQGAGEAAALQYGVGNWHLYNGRVDQAEEIFWRVTSAEDWAPFGYIAAEADLRRMLNRRRN
ncbi:tetratricopeptide repeat protein [Longimicrobium sp.]|uniref:tetratricopeptide repeat protein n=1 Tax=Longimicrobium sp. TaxID=2029185 RepID=UPI003B3B69CF